MNEFQHIVRSRPLRPRFTRSANLNQRTAVLLACLEQTRFWIGRFGLYVDGKMALNLLPPQGSFGADDEIEDASCNAKSFLDPVF